MNKPDRRIEKTRTAIFEALSELLREKKYANITIQEIIDRANVGRTTFYSHFPAKDDLLIACIDNIFESLNLHLAHHVQESEIHTRLIPVSELFVHIKENIRLIKGVMYAEGGDLLFGKFKSYWNEKIKNFLEEQLMDGAKLKVPVSILTNHITSTLVELIKWWINTDMSYTPKQMEQYYQELILPCIAFDGWL